jgi:hypothetical protein
MNRTMHERGNQQRQSSTPKVFRSGLSGQIHGLRFPIMSWFL